MWVAVTSVFVIVLRPELGSKRFEGFDRTAIVFCNHITMLWSYRYDRVWSDAEFLKSRREVFPKLVSYARESALDSELTSYRAVVEVLSRSATRRVADRAVDR